MDNPSSIISTTTTLTPSTLDLKKTADTTNEEEKSINELDDDSDNESWHSV
jgi:hypothetical protein